MAHRPRSAFTLLELALVVAVVAALALVAAPRLRGWSDRARAVAALSGAEALREAFAGTDGAPGYFADMAGFPGFDPARARVSNLLMPTGLVARGDCMLVPDSAPPEGVGPFAEAAERWRGPYAASRAGAGAVFPAPWEDGALFRGFYPWPDRPVTNVSHRFSSRDTNVVSVLAGAFTNVYGRAGEPAVLDPWGSPFVLQVPPPEAWDDPDSVPSETRLRFARIVSAGPNGILETPFYPTESHPGWDALDPAARRLDVRLAGRLGPGGGASGPPLSRGDDVGLFLFRSDSHEENDR